MRRGRHTTIADESILSATRALLAEQGPLVPSALIAARAGVSEGTIFKRFATKADLFRAALEVDEEELVRPFQRLDAAAGSATVRANLADAAHAFVHARERLATPLRAQLRSQRSGDPDSRERLRVTVAAHVDAYLALEASVGRVPASMAKSFGTAYVACLWGLGAERADEELREALDVLFGAIAHAAA
ncbi:MAG: TetR/AcrR family transcriptional regulator [Polyangiaceae bacterium]|nr:TetR/AcrR family transcriptional regulator [Polyangiaceae bacterium]